MKDSHRERVRAVKTGQVSREDVLAEIREWESRLREVLDSGKTPLPPRPDYQGVSQWLQRAHARQWRDFPGWR